MHANSEITPKTWRQQVHSIEQMHNINCPIKEYFLGYIKIKIFFIQHTKQNLESLWAISFNFDVFLIYFKFSWSYRFQISIKLKAFILEIEITPKDYQDDHLKCHILLWIKFNKPRVPLNNLSKWEKLTTSNRVTKQILETGPIQKPIKLISLEKSKEANYK